VALAVIAALSLAVSGCGWFDQSEVTRDIPVVMLTAKSSQSDRLRCEEMGAVDYVTKPFNLEQLRSKVRRIVESPYGSQASS
jgi:twitching motility two-component system response regulator PilG